MENCFETPVLPLEMPELERVFSLIRFNFASF